MHYENYETSCKMIEKLKTLSMVDCFHHLLHQLNIPISNKLSDYETKTKEKIVQALIDIEHPRAQNQKFREFYHKLTSSLSTHYHKQTKKID